MRRLALAGAVLLAAIVLACAPRAPKRNEVVFWVAWPESVTSPLVRRFEAANPGVQVRVDRMPRASVRESLAAALAAGRPPDLCEVASADMPALLGSGALSDWSAGVADLRDSLRGWPLCMVGDAIYGVPWLLEPRVLVYDRALFTRARMDPERAPQTWAELVSAASRIQRLGHGVRGFGIALDDSQHVLPAFLPFAWGNGGEVLSAGLDSSRLDSPRNVEALECLVKLRAAGTMDTVAGLERSFLAGRLGMAIVEASLFSRLEAQVAGKRYGLSLVPAPAARRGERTSLAAGELLVSFTSSRRKEDALRLARFLVLPENALAVAAAARVAQPSAVGAASSAYYRSHPRENVLARQVATARFVPSHRQWEAVARTIEGELEQALGGHKSAAAAIADAAASLDELLSGSRH